VSECQPNPTCGRTTKPLALPAAAGSDGHGTHARTHARSLACVLRCGVCVVSGLSVMSGMSCHDSLVPSPSPSPSPPTPTPAPQGFGAHFRPWMDARVALLRMPCVLVRSAHLRCACCCCWLVCLSGERAIAIPLHRITTGTALSQLRPAALCPPAAAAARRAGYCISIMRCFVRPVLPVLILPHPR
jgi:hypothetical protein